MGARSGLVRRLRRPHQGTEITPATRAPQPPPDDDALLDRLQRETFEYFLKEVNPLNGLVADKTRDGWPTLRFFRDSVQATTPDATGYKGSGARQRARLFREQPSRHLCAARVRDPQSTGVCVLQQGLLGHDGERRAGSRHIEG